MRRRKWISISIRTCEVSLATVALQLGKIFMYLVAGHMLAQSDLYSSHASHRSASDTSRPSIITNLSYVESDTFDEAGHEGMGYRHYDPSPSNRTSLVGDMSSVQKNKTRLLGRPRRPLERMVSTGSSRKAIAAGAEWVHWGHVDAVYEEELARQARERGLRRR